MQVLEILLTIVYQASVAMACIEKRTNLLHNYFDLSVKKYFFSKVDQNNEGKK
jgi:hypothetical protein